MGAQTVWCSKIHRLLNNLWVHKVGTMKCWYSKTMCTQNLWVLKNVNLKNVSVFSFGTKIVGTHRRENSKCVGIQIYGYSKIVWVGAYSKNKWN